jgi:hypothetical protein
MMAAFISASTNFFFVSHIPLGRKNLAYYNELFLKEAIRKTKAKFENLNKKRPVHRKDIGTGRFLFKCKWIGRI